MKKLVAFLAALGAITAAQATPILTATVDESSGHSIVIDLHPSDVGGHEGDYALDGHFIGRFGPGGVSFSYDRTIAGIDEPDYVNPDPIPPYFTVGAHVASFGYTGGTLFAPYRITTIPLGPGETPPVSAPDGGATALLLGAPALGMLAFRKKK